MPTVQLRIPNISCMHCVNAIKEELESLDGVGRAAGDPETRLVTVEYEPPASEEAVRAALESINYPAD